MIINSNGFVEPSPDFKLLWTNGSPTTSFHPQTIAIDLSKYTMVYMVFMKSTTQQYPIIQPIIVLPDSVMSRFGVQELVQYYDGATAYNQLVIIKSDGITFPSYCMKYGTSGSETANTWIVPFQVYGR